MALHWRSMEARPRRRFTLSDAILLITALAIGLAWMRYYRRTVAGDTSFPNVIDTPSAAFPGFYRVRVARWWIECSYHAVAPVTLAVLVARLRKPRPQLQRLTRQPGTVGCAAAVLAAVVHHLLKIFDAVLNWFGGDFWHDFGTLAYSQGDAAYPGLAIAAVWLLLAISGRWRRERDWIDRTGIALSLFWLAAPIAVGTVDFTMAVYEWVSYP